MSIHETLVGFKAADPAKNIRKALKDGAIPLQKHVLSLLSIIVAEGKNYYGSNEVTMEHLAKANDIVKDNVWEDADFYALLQYLFGDKAPLVKQILTRSNTYMYQTGYQRRSFRAPHHRDSILTNQLTILKDLLTLPGAYEQEYVYYNLPLLEQVRYSSSLYINDGYVYLWAMAIDQGDIALYQLMEDIINGKDAVGKVSRPIIKALLLTDKKEAWVSVEKLLLAAQRQEGLRQTILESLDETSVGAIQHMIKVVIEHKLARFSSVVRAVDTWTGLGWEAEKETTIRNVLGFANQFFDDPSLIAAAVKSKNNNEAYMALWVQGVLDVEQTFPYLYDLLENGSLEKKCLALKFANETQLTGHQIMFYYHAFQQNNQQLFSVFLDSLNMILNRYDYSNHELLPGFFEMAWEAAANNPVKEKTFEGKVFSWLTTVFTQDLLYRTAIYLVGSHQERLEKILSQFENLSIDIRTELTRKILKGYYSYSFYGSSSSDKVSDKITAFQRSFALQLLKDRGESMLASGINVLSRLKLTTEEVASLSDLFKRKGTGLRKHLVELVAKQDDEVVIPFAETLIATGDVEQRLGSLDILLQLYQAKRSEKKVSEMVMAYKTRPKIAAKEKQLLDQMDPENDRTVANAENGYLLYNVKNVTPYALPEVPKDSFYLKSIAKNEHGFSTHLSAIKVSLAALEKLFQENKNFEYQQERYDKSVETLLLGNDFGPFKYDHSLKGKERLENYPLHELWDKWYLESGLKPIDLYLLVFEESNDRKKWRDILEKYVVYNKSLIPAPKGSYYWNNPYRLILELLSEKYPFVEKNGFLIGATINLYHHIPEEVLTFKAVPERYYGRDQGDGWQQEWCFHTFLHKIDITSLNKDQTALVWNTYRWRQYSGLPENSVHALPPLLLYAKAYEHGIITKDELIEGVLEPDRIRELTTTAKKKNDEQPILDTYPFLKAEVDIIREWFLDIEVKRGDANTTVTHFVQNFQTVYGIDRFVQLLEGLGKSSINKGYIYSWNSDTVNKQKLFSTLLKHLQPRDTDTQEAFEALVKASKISEARLIEAAMYAPQWQKWVSAYLDWKGLDAGIWWMHAHTKTSGYSAVNAELESEVARFSSIDIDDFKEGAVDKEWFTKAYKELGKARWELLYEAAKYISDGNGHRRARLYSDTLSGDLKIKEVTAKVKDKRDQDYLRVYGLVPLSKANPEKDVLSRYEYLQQFKKESRQFGSMKQSSEAQALRVAMENLARNAGYEDPIRLTWAMETKQVQSILSKETQVDIDGVTVGLIIEEDGKAELVTFKGDKELKSIPPKVKKDPAVVELTAHRKTLREQFSRSRKGLEEAMIRGDVFLYTEMEKLFEHPVISKHLEKLIFISDNNATGFFSKGQLKDGKGKASKLTDKNTLRIAHCVDLHQQKVWTDYQTYCFENKLVQPFKQVFRELYIPTADELKEKAISRRYAGHQVQPRQTLALLKSRGWKVDYEEGLQKVFHKEGFQVKLYAMADWFSPADIESPTLETIEFHSLKDYKNIPFEEVNPRIFSEVMRDVDLVVSVAHVGGVDPEASQSSIEMRTVLLQETARLFKLKNVTIKGSHAFIKGSMAEYSVHLGSAVVHQVPGIYLSILPVHSQHRGRLFLPFADDDPKSAEMISKVLLLAKDEEIKDPTVLSQIKR